MGPNRAESRFILFPCLSRLHLPLALDAVAPALLHGRGYILFPRLSWLFVIVFRESALKPAAWFSCVVLNQITMFEVVACFSWALSLCPLCMRTSPHSTHTFNHGSLIFNFLLFPLISLNELKNGDTSRKFPCHCSGVWRSHKLSDVCVYKFNLTRALGRAWSVYLQKLRNKPCMTS